MKQLLFTMTLLASIAARAKDLPCFIHPTKGIVDADLSALAKITQVDAQSTALRAVTVNAASVNSGELEAEGGCPIYSFDMKRQGKRFIIDVAVDAGTGKVQSQKREGPKAQAAEAVADRAAARKH